MQNLFVHQDRAYRGELALHCRAGITAGAAQPLRTPECVRRLWRVIGPDDEPVLTADWAEAWRLAERGGRRITAVDVAE